MKVENELSDDEISVLELIRKESENNYISRYIFEGHLTYTLGFTDNKSYRTILKLINKGLLELVELSDGEYYHLI